MSMTFTLERLIAEEEVVVSGKVIQACACCGRRHYYIASRPLWLLVGSGGKGGGFKSYCQRCARHLFLDLFKRKKKNK